MSPTKLNGKPSKIADLEQQGLIVGWFSLSVEECQMGSAAWVAQFIRDKAERAVQEVMERAGERDWLDV